MTTTTFDFNNPVACDEQAVFASATNPAAYVVARRGTTVVYGGSEILVTEHETVTEARGDFAVLVESMGGDATRVTAEVVAARLAADEYTEEQRLLLVLDGGLPIRADGTAWVSEEAPMAAWISDGSVVVFQGDEVDPEVQHWGYAPIAPVAPESPAEAPESDEDGPFVVVRFRREGDPEVILRGLSRAEAQAHCRREDTHGDGWFDGFDSETLWPSSRDEA